jgi:hypothetical protein
MYFDYYEGVKLLVSAAQLKQNRAEALRAIAATSNAVANKIPFPITDKLFVEPGAYTANPTPMPLPSPEEEGPVPALPEIRPRVGNRRFFNRKKITAKDVGAVIVTRGNVSLDPCLETIPYEQVVIWDNSKRSDDYRIFGRYAAIPELDKPVIYFQDDDVIFRAHKELLAAWEPGKAVANMDQAWVHGAGYEDTLVLLGAGSLVPVTLPAKIFSLYLKHHPFDHDLLLEADFAFGTLAPWKRVDLGYETREFADGPDRLYTQPWQTARKWDMIDRCRNLRAQL